MAAIQQILLAVLNRFIGLELYGGGYLQLYGGGYLELYGGSFPANAMTFGDIPVLDTDGQYILT